MSDKNNFAGQYLSHLGLMTSSLNVLQESGAFSGRPWHLGMALLVRMANGGKTFLGISVSGWTTLLGLFMSADDCA